MPVRKLFARFLPVAAVATGLLIAAPAANAATAPRKGNTTASIALAHKRAAKVFATVTCQNTDLLPSAENLDQIRAAILCLHNQERAKKGLTALKDNARLRKGAVGHSVDMVSRGYFQHIGPSEVNFTDHIIGSGYTRRTDGWSLGENLAWGTGDLSTPAGVMAAWMNSAGHKSNILKKAYREIGIGIRLGVPSDGGVGATITADFGVKL